MMVMITRITENLSPLVAVPLQAPREPVLPGLELPAQDLLVQAPLVQANPRLRFFNLR